MSKKFVVTSALLPSESLRGYLLRVSEINGFPIADQVRVRMGLRRSYQSAPQSLVKAAEATGNSADLIRRCLYWPSGKGLVTFGDNFVRRGSINFTKPRVCPLCLEDVSRTRMAWDLQAYAACRKHHCVLVDQCPICHAQISWNRSAPNRCQCGARLDRVEAASVPDSVLDLIEMFDRLMEGGTCKAEDMPVKNLQQAVSFVWLLGTLSVRSTNWRSVYMSKPAVAETIPILIGASEAMLDWPNGMTKWIGNQCDRLESSQPMHKIGHFNSILGRIGVALSPQEAPEVHKLIREYLVTSGRTPGFRSNSRWYQSSQLMITGKAAARRLACRPDGIRALLGNGGLSGYTAATPKRTLTFVYSDSLNRVERARHGMVSSDALALRLKIARHQVDQIRRNGILLGKKGVGGSFCFPPDTVDAFHERLSRQAIELGSSDFCTIPLSDVPSLHCASIAKVLAFAFDRKINLYVCKNAITTSLGDFRVRPDDLMRCLGDSDHGQGASAEVAARALGVSKRMIPVLVRYNCLTLVRCDERGRGIGRRNISLKSIEEFPERYLWTREVMVALKTNSRTAMAYLRNAGHKLVVPADARKGQSALWQRNP